MRDGTASSLGDIPAGGTVAIRRVQGGKGLVSRLAAMGIFPGVALQVCRNDRTGPVVIGVHGSRIMLGRGMANRVSVEQRHHSARSIGPGLEASSPSACAS